ncbi:hypothetical protein TU94_00260 [Streptomyces cyaneogriseus subsp. noncyanogenus]|uniref:Uncharacterized protein n=1 Tax=Streptomyces cyaneogriseus subsp. noncyanogenus TaxID=477245 RepID=A0A0C5FKG1_9ACTN|nr:hypothetical protein TU94_00260 [Streptomyces cyaneogriseus subsp. noncyanogenus]
MYALDHRLAKACERMTCIQSGRRSSLFCVDSPRVETNLAYMALTYSSVTLSFSSRARARASRSVVRNFSSRFSVAPDV